MSGESTTSPVSLGLSNPIEAMRRFFHSEEIPYGMALTRIVLPWALFAAQARRWYFTREMFSLDGANAPIWNAYGYYRLLPQFSGTTMVVLHTALLVFLVTSSIGWRTRLSLFLSGLLFTYINMADCVGTIAKYSCIGTHALFILSMSHCGDVWSVDSWLKGWSRRSVPWPGESTAAWPKSSLWARRLLQFSLAAVYLGAAVTKLKTPLFFSGDQLTAWLLTNVNFEHRMGEYMAMHPALLVLTAYGTVLWEIMFIFLCWRGWWKYTVLALGLLFHLFTLTTLGLTIFPAVCAPIYFAFLDEQDFIVFFRWSRRLGRSYLSAWAWFARRIPRLTPPRVAWLPSPAAFVLICTAGIGAGTAAEYLLDPYGMRRPEGPYTLNRLDREFVARLMTPAPPLKDKDVFFSFDVGSIVAGGVLVNQKVQFRPGDKLVAQCAAVAPHEDMYVQCNLHDGDDRIMARAPVILNRESNRATFTFQLATALSPGDYYLVLSKDNSEITRRKVTLTPRPGAPSVRAPVAQ